MLIGLLKFRATRRVFLIFKLIQWNHYFLHKVSYDSIEVFTEDFNDFKEEHMDYKDLILCISIMRKFYSFKNISDK